MKRTGDRGVQLSRVIRFVFCVEVMLLSLAGTAQEYAYKHYDAKDGLANSSVYQMLQDKDGFIWFATQSGVSRFDGTHFKSFSTLDGLPVNDIIRMFEDSRGRIWLIPFKNAICYYYKGKIYNQQNDSVLKKIELSAFVEEIVENRHGDLLLNDSKKIYHIDGQGHVQSIGQDLLADALGAQLSVNDSGEFVLRFDEKVFSTDGRTFSFLRNIHATPTLQHFILDDRIDVWTERNTLCVESTYYGNLSYRQVIGPVNTMYLLNDTILCLNTTRGTRLFNLLQRKIEQRFLPNGNVSHFLVDKEGGYWFSTLNDGVFQLGSPVFKSITGHTDAGQKLGVYSLEKFNGHIWAGCDMGHIMKISNNTANLVRLNVGGEVLGTHPVYAMTAKENQLAAACGEYVFVKARESQFKPRTGPGSTKQIAWKTDHELLIASSQCLYTMQIDEFNQYAINNNGRTTCLYYRNDSTWFGTFNGLYLMKPDASITYLGATDPLLSVSIVSIQAGLDGTIWIATNGSGLIGLQNNKVAWHFGKHNGLKSDKVRCIGIDSGFVWAATEKELNKISLQSKPVITRYSFADELNSDIVNTILVDNNIVYAGTPDGITWFDKREKATPSLCNLKLLGVNVNAAPTALRPSYSLPYKNNSIRFDYVAISMKSAGNIVYYYRLDGLDTSWKSTTQTSLDLISLPPGEYKLELFAVNEFDVKSSVYSVNLVVQNPFWKSAWFMISAILLASLIAWLIGTRHNRAIIRKEKARRLAEQQLLELEQKALRAQMNPHFIFNCLHSIQSFILDEDTEKANKYLSRFANLIRQTLENSLQSSISLADEIKYLGTYLQLEQMRSESGFDYRIDTDANVSPAAISMPVMVLQPFVENAVRHGVQGVKGRTALINLHFSVSGDQLVCRVQDNGIGRQRAQLRKSAEPVVYQSRGMQLTYERIELINKNSDRKITVEIVDKFNERDEPNGTDVIVRFPIFTVKDATLS